MAPIIQPNILLITSDQQRYDTVGPNAPAFLRTPHFDRLCHEGVVFSSAYSDCPLCVPARVSIMTGKQVFNHGMAFNGETSKVLGHANTLPMYLRQLGYQTAAIGKMHFGPQRIRHGFDEMIIPEDYYKQMRQEGYNCQPMWHGMGQNEIYPTMATVPESKTLTAWIAEQCAEYILERRDPSVPFFLWCSFSKPHPPFDPPEPYYSMYRNCPIPEPIFGDWSEPDKAPSAFQRYQQLQSYDLIPLEIIKEARAAYYGLITQVDYNLGKVLGALQDLKMLAETLIIYTSDHGEYLGDHHTGAKGFFHESSAHIPLVVRLPQSWSKRCHGQTITTPVTHADILPTLVVAAGGNPPSDTDGMDLVALARGELKENRQYLEAMMGNVTEWLGPVSECDYLAITDGRWKYIWYPEGAVEQLFDLENDPRELKDIAGLAENEGKLLELKQELINRNKARASKFIIDGKLITKPLRNDQTVERRNQSWPGYHTDHFRVDVRH